MTHPLDGTRLKLVRANQHLQTINDEIERFLKRDPYSAVVELDSQTCYYVIRAKVAEEPPPEWGVLIGDCLHNFRSGLDHLAWQLVIVNGGAPSQRTEFPIFRDSVAYKRTSKGLPARGSGLEKVDGMGPRAQAIVEGLQPYHRRNNPKSHPLWLLQDLSNTDKHQVLNVAGSFVHGTTFWGPAVDVSTLIYREVHDGAVIASTHISPPQPKPKMGVDFDFSFGISFSEIGPAPAHPVIPLLRTIRDFINGQVMAQLGPLFPS